MDLSPFVNNQGDKGLLDILFDQNFAQNGFFYAYYTRSDVAYATTLHEYVYTLMSPSCGAIVALARAWPPRHGSHASRIGRTKAESLAGAILPGQGLVGVEEVYGANLVVVRR